MVRLSRFLRDYSDAGGVNTLVSLWGFVDGGTFLTKAGHVGDQRDTQHRSLEAGKGRNPEW